MKAFKVGQIAYVIIAHKRIIVPVKITEQIVRRTEDEELIDWSILLPDDDQKLLVSELKEEIYSDLDEAKDHLLNQAKRSIEKIVSTCLELQEKTWPNQKKHQEKINNLNIKNNNINGDKIKITLSDGTVANVAVPPISEE